MTDAPDVERVRWAVAACKLWVAQDEMPVRHELLTALRWVLENGQLDVDHWQPGYDHVWRKLRDAVGVRDG